MIEDDFGTSLRYSVSISNNFEFEVITEDDPF